MDDRPVDETGLPATPPQPSAGAGDTSEVAPQKRTRLQRGFKAVVSWTGWSGWSWQGWNAVGAMSTFFGAVGLLVALWQTNVSYRLAVKSSEESGKDTSRLLHLLVEQLERTDRPYISVDVVSDGPVVVAGQPPVSAFNGPLPAHGTQFAFQLVLRNDGRSPASNVPPSTALAIAPKDVHGGVLSACQVAERMMVAVGGGLIALRPFETIGMSQIVNVPDETILSNLTAAPGLSGKYFTPVLVGCVAYKIPYSKRVHHTGFAVDVLKATPPGLFEFGTGVPASHVIFIRNNREGAPQD